MSDKKDRGIKKKGGRLGRNRITILTKDDSRIASVDASTRIVERGDLLVFASRHEGDRPPAALELIFPRGNVCNEENSTIKMINLPVNSFVQVRICRSAPFGRLGFEINGYKVRDGHAADIVVGDEGD